MPPDGVRWGTVETCGESIHIRRKEIPHAEGRCLDGSASNAGFRL